MWHFLPINWCKIILSIEYIIAKDTLGISWNCENTKLNMILRIMRGLSIYSRKITPSMEPIFVKNTLGTSWKLSKMQKWIYIFVECIYKWVQIWSSSAKNALRGHLFKKRDRNGTARLERSTCLYGMSRFNWLASF